MSALAQSPKAYVKAGDEAFARGNYFSALEYYQEAEALGKSDATLYYKIAEAAHGYAALEIAGTYYQKYIEKSKEKEQPEVWIKMGEVKRLQSDYPEAIDCYEKFITKNTDAALEQEALKKIGLCQWAMEQIAVADSMDIVALNKRVNSAYSDFAPFFTGDTLYYSSYKFSNPSDEHIPKRFLSKVLFSVKGSRGRSLPGSFNKKGILTAHTRITEDGKRLFFTRCHYTKKGTIRCGIYYSTKDKRKRWGKAKKIAKLNNKAYTFTQPTTGLLDGKEVLFFVSDQPGGKGKLDIWYAVLQEDFSLGKIEPLNTINTEEDDITPFYHRASGDLYFSSKGYDGFGGYDIFRCRQSGERWGAVAHTGYPLNSGYNDMYYTLTADSSVAYLASNRPGSMYLEKSYKTCCNDIYKVKFLFPEIEDIPQEPEIDSLVMVEIPEVEIPEVPEKIVTKIVVVEEKTPERLEDFLPLSLYFDNDEPDKRTRKSTTDKTYGESFEQYYARKEVYIRENTAPNIGMAKEVAEKDIKNFFNNELKRDNNFLNLFSQILLTRLMAGETIEIFIKGYTSPRAQSDYNFYLGKRRISSVLNHFRKYQQGVFLPYFNSGKLIITERSFGETTASKDISDSLEDTRNSIYSIEAARARRVEIVEIKRFGKQ